MTTITNHHPNITIEMIITTTVIVVGVIYQILAIVIEEIPIDMITAIIMIENRLAQQW